MTFHLMFISLTKMMPHLLHERKVSSEISQKLMKQKNAKTKRNYRGISVLYSQNFVFFDEFSWKFCSFNSVFFLPNVSIIFSQTFRISYFTKVSHFFWKQVEAKKRENNDFPVSLETLHESLEYPMFNTV